MNTLITKNFDFSQKSLQQFLSTRKEVFYPKADIIFSEKHLVKEKEKILRISEKQIDTIFLESLRERVVEYSLITTRSTYHVLYRVRTNKHTYVLRISALRNLYSDFTFFIDQKIQDMLSALSISSVQVYTVDVERKLYPYDFMIMDFVDGVTLEDHRYSAQKNVYTDLGTIFKEIQTIPVQGVGLVNIKTLLKENKFSGTSSSWKEFFYKNIHDHIEKTYALKVITKKSKETIEKIFSEKLEDLENRPLVLIHNDLATRNIIFNKTKITAILDWEDAIIGDPFWEIAFVNTFLFEEKQQLYFRAFCKSLGINEAKLKSSYLYWMYFLRIMLAKVATRSVSGYYNAKGVANDKQRVMTALNNIKVLHE